MNSLTFGTMNTTLTNLVISIVTVICFSGVSSRPARAQGKTSPASVGPILVVLGNVQDGGSPHIGCNRECCRELFKHPDPTRKVVSLGLIEPGQRKTWLFEATPDITAQLKMLKNISLSESEMPEGIFVTHAHIGHYTGLMYLGKEAFNAHKIPVYAMPRMREFLETNGPWSQLVADSNILIRPLANKAPVRIVPGITVTPIEVPHRDEYSETVGYRIDGPSKKALFIPDIDKWEKWDHDIDAEIGKVDYAFIDASFFDAGELPNRDISTIPHPLVTESMAKFSRFPASERNKIYFIHFNHTNPLLNQASPQSARVIQAGFHAARPGQQFPL